MARIAALGLAVPLVWILVVTAALADELSHWQEIEDNPECVLWNWYPHENETVTWSGACANGKAQGHGTAVWPNFEDGEWSEIRYEGEFKDGKWHGHGVLELPDGGRYEGGFRNGRWHGHGVHVLGDGRRYEG